VGFGNGRHVRGFRSARQQLDNPETTVKLALRNPALRVCVMVNRQLSSPLPISWGTGCIDPSGLFAHPSPVGDCQSRTDHLRGVDGGEGRADNSRVVHIADNDPDRIRTAASLIPVMAGVVIFAVYICTIRLHLAYPLYLAAGVVAILVTRVPLSLLRWRGEFRADRDGAILTGHPIEMACALTAAKRFARSRSYPGIRFWRVIFAPFTYTAPTHPPMSTRVKRLERMAVAD
jgi:hypothetical protein